MIGGNLDGCAVPEGKYECRYDEIEQEADIMLTFMEEHGCFPAVDGVYLIVYCEHRHYRHPEGEDGEAVQREVVKVYRRIQSEYLDRTENFAEEIKERNGREELAFLPVLIREAYDSSIRDEDNTYPDIAEVTVRYKDTGDEMDCNISLLPIMETKVSDDEVFFYTEGIDGLVALTAEDNGEDFIVTDIKGFTHYPPLDKK